MSIKQNGGVFGRNPTFNDVTIEGQLTFDGDIDINSDLKVDGDLDVTGAITVDTDTLVVNDTSNNVGIGTASPNASGSLHILRAGSSIISNLIANSGAILESGSGSVGFNVITPNTAGGYINFGDPEDSNAGRILYSHATNAMSFGTNDSTIRLEIDASGNTNVKTGNLVIGTAPLAKASTSLLPLDLAPLSCSMITRRVYGHLHQQAELLQLMTQHIQKLVV